MEGWASDCFLSLTFFLSGSIFSTLACSISDLSSSSSIFWVLFSALNPVFNWVYLRVDYNYLPLHCQSFQCTPLPVAWRTHKQHIDLNGCVGLPCSQHSTPNSAHWSRVWRSGQYVGSEPMQTDKQYPSEWTGTSNNFQACWPLIPHVNCWPTLSWINTSAIHRFEWHKGFLRSWLEMHVLYHRWVPYHQKMTYSFLM